MIVWYFLSLEGSFCHENGVRTFVALKIRLFFTASVKRPSTENEQNLKQRKKKNDEHENEMEDRKQHPKVLTAIPSETLWWSRIVHFSVALLSFHALSGTLYCNEHNRNDFWDFCFMKFLLLFNATADTVLCHVCLEDYLAILKAEKFSILSAP